MGYNHEKKRPFERNGAYLIDCREDAAGRRTIVHMPAEALGETAQTDHTSRRRAIEEFLQGVSTADLAMVELRAAASENLLEVLLAGIAAGNDQAPYGLLNFLEDLRVRPALADAAQRAPARTLSNFAHVLGLVGGDKAQSVLRERLRELLANQETFSVVPFANDYAQSLKSAAAGLLRLDPDALDAARALVRLFRHPCAFNRRAAVQEAVEVFRRELHTAAMREIASALNGLLNESEHELFLEAVPILVGKHVDAVLERCEALLNHQDHSLRQAAARAIISINITPPYTARALALLVRWLPHGEPLELTTWIASAVQPLLPEQVVESLVRRALASESPWLRHGGIIESGALPRHVARPMLEEALKDEPDPLLLRKLQERLAGIE